VILICVLGFVANLAMLISLLVHRQAARTTVNVFVCNQIILDIAATLVSGTKLCLMVSGYLKSKNGVLRMLVCLLIDSDALVSSAIYGSVYGLVIITVERYVKIVHPIAHRNHYRRWMTVAGVASPWVIGLLTSCVPSLTTAKFIDGSCRTQVDTTALFSVHVLFYTTRAVLNELVKCSLCVQLDT